MFLQGHAGNLKTLRQADTAKADLFIAVTDNSEVNLLSAIRAKDEGAKRTIARVEEPAYFEEDRGLFAGMFGIDLVINPQALIAAIIRDDSLIVPGGDDSIHPGDEVIAVGHIEQIPRVEQLFKRERKKYTKRVIIVGGSQTGSMVAGALVDDDIEVLLIEKDLETCRQLSESLPGVTILHGDGTNVHFLEEERMDHSDAFVAVSGEDEINLMASLLARDLGASRIIAMVHKPDYGPICERLGIDSFLSPRLEVAKQVLKYVRAGEVVGITRILEDAGEFLEFVVPEHAPIVGTPLKDVDFPDGANICAVVNTNGAFVPRGDYIIEPRDRVVVFTITENRADVEEAFHEPSASD